eukprot:TRINITY_DN76694_c0_g1_i1.p1 TRINITY_DN76694_c0_g1~~TRINITY_DN76694_c0_g1_i1.p1  ORF type:complete len:739 (-),score=102.19 TRINITY_DN76694_c0_g1_i1:201-2315(-)
MLLLSLTALGLVTAAAEDAVVQKASDKPAGDLRVLSSMLGVVPQPPSVEGERRIPFYNRRVQSGDLPLRTSGRYIVNKHNERVKWTCVNWYGAYAKGQMVVGGLEVQPINVIVGRIVEMGFNCVRLPYSTAGFWENPIINASFVKANPQFANKRFLDVFDATVEALTQARLMVIVNNHISKNMWCCLFSMDEGLWHVPEWSEKKWIGSLEGMATRYRSNPFVVAYDVRNEPHDFQETKLTWGDGNPETDFAAAAERAGNAVLAKAPDALIVVEALCFASDLRGIKEHPIKLSQPARVVYEVHNYLEFQDYTLFSKQITSYKNLHHQLWAVSFLLIATLVVLVIMWNCVGAPRPPRGLFFFTTGSFSTVIGVMILYILHVIMPSISRMKGCDFGVRQDYDMLFNVGYLALFAGLALFVLSYLTAHRILPDFFPTRKRYPGFLGFPGWRSCRVLRLQSRIWLRYFINGPEERRLLTMGSSQRGNRVAAQEEEELIKRESDENSDDRQVSQSSSEEEVQEHEIEFEAEWDQGVCTGFLIFVVCLVLVFPAVTVEGSLQYISSYSMMEANLDAKWGFALEEGRAYTAPVWMGEFGEVVRGSYWLHLLTYLAERDVDFGFWPLNGMAYKDVDMKIENANFWGLMRGSLTGSFKPKEASWVEEGWGLLKPDYVTVRQPWVLQDLQNLMVSRQPINPKRCSRYFLGDRCGG